MIVSEIVGARRGVAGGEDTGDDIVDMDAAEHLRRQADTMGAPRRHALERRAAGAVDAGQAENMRAAGQPGGIGGGARRAAARAGGGGFVDPGAARVAIDAGRGQIAEPAVVQRVAVARQDGVGVPLRRDRGQDMGGGGQRGADGRFVVEAERAVSTVAGGADGCFRPGGGDAGGGVAEAEDQEHGVSPHAPSPRTRSGVHSAARGTVGAACRSLAARRSPERVRGDESEEALTAPSGRCRWCRNNRPCSTLGAVARRRRRGRSRNWSRRSGRPDPTGSAG